jgi:hypothetical protein
MRFRTLIIGLTAIMLGLLGVQRPAHAELMTFHLSVGDALASVGKTNAFLVSIGKQAAASSSCPAAHASPVSPVRGSATSTNSHR